jgi:hypothetical protein
VNDLTPSDLRFNADQLERAGVEAVSAWPLPARRDLDAHEVKAAAMLAMWQERIAHCDSVDSHGADLLTAEQARQRKDREGYREGRGEPI